MLNHKSTVILFMALLAAGCAKKPTQPGLSNPFDPENSFFRGNPLSARVEIANGGITVHWNSVKSGAVKGYRVYRRVDTENMPVLIASIGAENTVNNAYVDTRVASGRVYYYSVTAFGEKDQESPASIAMEVNLPVIPFISINGGDKFTNNRTVNLTLLANSALEMCISGLPDFLQAVWEPFRTSRSWTLPVPDGVKVVFAKVRNSAGTESIVVSDTIIVDTVKPTSLCEVKPDSGTQNTFFEFNVLKADDDITDSNLLLFRFSNIPGIDRWSNERRTVWRFGQESGFINVIFQCKDEAGNVNESTLTVYVNTPPSANFLYFIKPGGTFEYGFYPLGFDREDPRAECLYRWNIDVDGQFDTDWAAADTVYWKFPGPGSYPVTLEMKDTGRMNDAATINFMISSENMVFVPASEFTSGCSGEGRSEFVDGFWIDKYEVTIPEFVKFLNPVLAQPGARMEGDFVVDGNGTLIFDTKSTPDVWYDHGYFRGTTEKVPVRYLPKYSMEQYARFHGKRLPTAMEWEKAARGTDGRIYPWGNDPPDPGKCNFSLGQPVAVGSFSPEGDSYYGCSDMAGNVSEYVEGWLRGGDFLSKGVSQVLLQSCNVITLIDMDHSHQGWGFRCVIGPAGN